MHQQVQYSERYYQLCSICCEQHTRSSQTLDHLRPPEICYPCWHSHILNIVNRISYMAGDDIMSPFNNGPSFDIISALNSLLPDHALQIQERLYRKYTSFTQDIQKCPAQNCDFVYVGEKCLWNSKENVYNCPKCQMSLSAIQPYSIKSIMASIYLLLANKCPKCQIPIQKISGCPHMTCPCGHQFCWFCYKDQTYGVKKRLYNSHEVPECSFIMISKIMIFIISICGLMLTINGNQTIRWIQDWIFTILSILFRSVLIDGWILLQVFIVMVQTKRRRGRGRSYYHENNRGYKFIGLMVAINLIILPVFLYSIGELYCILMILLGEVLIGGIGFGVGYSVAFSVDTWFQYVQ